MPADATLTEVQDYLVADNADQRHAVLSSIYERLGQGAPPEEGEPGLRVLTMHGAKGLQAKVVFIPCLEEYVLPGSGRLPDEGARLLYVSITRARAAVILSYAKHRYYGGKWLGPAESQYCGHLGGPFGTRTVGLAPSDIAAIQSSIVDMQ